MIYICISYSCGLWNHRYVDTTELKNLHILVLGLPVQSTSVLKKAEYSD